MQWFWVHNWPSVLFSEVIPERFSSAYFLFVWSFFVRNGCDPTRVQTEYSNFKTLVRGTFQDKSFSALFQLLLTKDPYKEDFKVYIKMFYLSGLNTKKCSKAYNVQELYSLCCLVNNCCELYELSEYIN